MDTENKKGKILIHKGLEEQFKNYNWIEKTEFYFYMLKNKYFVFSPKILKMYDEKAVMRFPVNLQKEEDEFYFELPINIYNFYELDRNEINQTILPDPVPRIFFSLIENFKY